MKYKPYENEFWNEKEAKELFQILSFYNVLTEKPKIKHLSKIELLHELQFKIEIIDSKDPLEQLRASKSSIEDLSKEVTNEIKSFKYQITVSLCKNKKKGDIEYPSVYFNSATKRVISFNKYDLDKSFQEILYRIDNWINEGSGCITESIEAQYVNISIYSPLIGSTCIEIN